MKRAAAICLAVIFPSGSGVAQGTAATPMDDIVAENWIVSETTSPFDYAPVIIASAVAHERPNDPAVQLSIQCRRGRTDLVMVSPRLAGRPEDYRLSYIVNNSRPVAVLSGPAASGTGISVREDVVRLLTGLPSRGDITFQVTVPQTAPIQARFALGPFRSVVDRIAGPCKWPVTGPVSPQAQPK
jgi:hypothetical protein